MYRYKCPACQRNAFSASRDKGDEPCIYCGHPGTEIQPELRPLDEMLVENEVTNAYCTHQS